MRPQAEKVILAVLGLGSALYFYGVLYYEPVREQAASLERQLATVQARMLEQSTRATELQQSGVEDPDAFIRERLAELVAEQDNIQSGIQSLAGNLVSPNGMTQMLTSVLDSQEGLTLIRVENRPPEALTNPVTAVTEGEGDVQGAPLRSIGFQVYRHGLILEFQGDYFSTLRYLLFLEEMDESFFWDRFEFEQTLWPQARVILELHTLSSEEGFIGV